jgi:hypothetical protein
MARTIQILLLMVAMLQPVAASAEGELSAENVEIVSSLWCDTADQLETVLVAHYKNKKPMGQAMAEINRFSPDACIVARAIVRPGDEVRRVTAGNNIMSLRSALVLGIMRGQYAMMMRPQTWYFVRIVDELIQL